MLLYNFQTAVTDRLCKQQRAIQVLQRIASAAELVVLFRDKRDVIFFVRRESGIWYSQSLQSIHCGSQVVEHLYAILLSSTQILAASN